MDLQESNIYLSIKLSNKFPIFNHRPKFIWHTGFGFNMANLDPCSPSTGVSVF